MVTGYRLYAIIVLSVVLCLGCSPDPVQPPAVGDRAPDFSLQDLEGNELRLSELAAQGPVVVNFWATWCGPCTLELPYLDQMQVELATDGLTVVAVSVDARSDDVRRYLRNNPLAVTVLLDPRGNVADAYGVSGIPHTFLLDRDLTVRTSLVGFSSAAMDRLWQEVERCLDYE